MANQWLHRSVNSITWSENDCYIVLCACVQTHTCAHADTPTNTNTVTLLRL